MLQEKNGNLDNKDKITSAARWRYAGSSSQPILDSAFRISAGSTKPCLSTGHRLVVPNSASVPVI
eukprot:1799833-Rhodomonas_salina.1